MIKRPVRKAQGGGFESQADDVQIYEPRRPSTIDVTNEDEEEKNEMVINDCDFNISPSRVPPSDKKSFLPRNDDASDLAEDGINLNASLSKLPRMIVNQEVPQPEYLLPKKGRSSLAAAAS